MNEVPSGTCLLKYICKNGKMGLEVEQLEV